jgi:hypothetical protein
MREGESPRVVVRREWPGGESDSRAAEALVVSRIVRSSMSRFPRGRLARVLFALVSFVLVSRLFVLVSRLFVLVSRLFVLVSRLFMRLTVQQGRHMHPMTRA